MILSKIFLFFFLNFKRHKTLIFSRSENKMSNFSLFFVHFDLIRKTNQTWQIFFVIIVSLNKRVIFRERKINKSKILVPLNNIIEGKKTIFKWNFI